MPLRLDGNEIADFQVRKIAVIGPGIVGMPMAALLAQDRIREGSPIAPSAPATVTVIQRDSPTSGWKVEAINRGESPIGGVEPELSEIVREAVDAGLLTATHDPAAARDADLVLVAVQTDKDGMEPDYGPLMSALDGLCPELKHRPAGNLPVVVFESTLAPSSMATVVRERFAAHGLHEGRDVLLGNSPNRVMPGRLVDRVRASDKLVAGLHPATPEIIARVYRHVVRAGALHRTNSLTAEIVKTLENAYRDVRIAFSAEVARRWLTTVGSSPPVASTTHRRHMRCRSRNGASEASTAPRSRCWAPRIVSTRRIRATRRRWRSHRSCRRRDATSACTTRT
jgi:UDP-N-acetyl-D-mannosaminuronic acid dehydrogenase